MRGKLVISLAGHDQGKLYYVVNQCGQYVYLADGKQKKDSNLKKKNRKHIKIAELDEYNLNMDTIVHSDSINNLMRRNIRKAKMQTNIRR